MPVMPTYPGVYVEEIPSGVRTVVGVSTSIAAFIGSFRRGPLNKAVQIFSFADFEREFGGLEATSEASYAVQQFFLNGGTQAWVVRTASGTNTSDPPLAAASVVLQDSIDGTAALTVSAISPGEWGNALKVKVNYQTFPGTEELFNLIIEEYSSVDSDDPLIKTEVFQNLSMAVDHPNYVESVLNDESSGSQLVRVNVDNPGSSPPRPLDNGVIFSGELLTEDLSAILSPLMNSNPEIEVTISEEVATAALGAQPSTNDPATFLAEVRALLEAAIRSSNPASPAYAGTTVEIVGNRLRILAGSGSPGNIVRFSATANDTTTVDELQLADSSITANVQAYQVGGPPEITTLPLTGAQGARVSGRNGALPDRFALVGNANDKSGLFALENVDLFNILCIPRTASGSAPAALPANEAADVRSVAIAYCEARRAMFIVDIPETVTDIQAVQNFVDTLPKSRNAAVYFPRVKIADPLRNFRLRSIGASGTVAGVWARTDAQRGIWKAPAGIEATLLNVPHLDVQLTDAQNGVLNPLGINCLRSFSVYGRVVWGTRTLRGADILADDYKAIPVRRLALFIEESLFRGLKWVVFEPNDEPLWAQIRLNVGAFMQSLFRQGAFQGNTPRDAYLVKCDRETTTQNDINQGIVNILVGFAPLKPAEFVFIKLQQLAGQIQV